MTNPGPPPPAQWPKEVSDGYAPVRVIGKGGFASVWMAKSKKDDEMVAVKIMQDDGYAKREVEILSELSSKACAHPDMVRLVDSCRAETKCGDGGFVRCAVLSLARGPTLNSILAKEGGLGLVVAQTISRQLIDVVAYLHGFAVIHRDIQPCNIIVSGSRIDDDLWWSDDLDVDGKLLKMAKQCRITLVDFGFARALSQADIKTDKGLKKLDDERSKTESTDPKTEQAIDGEFIDSSCINQPLNDSLHGENKSRGRGRTRTTDFDSSVSHNRVRDLSALGTRNYAAPEIMAGIRNLGESLNNSFRGPKKSLAACVSNYGMDADAYSIGATIRYMVTGVSPEIDVEDFLASKNHPLKKMGRSFRKRLSVSKKGPQKRVKKYRLSEDLPSEVSQLVGALTHYNSRKRATVRSVTDHPWIKGAPSSDSGGKGEGGAGAGRRGPIEYLKCAEEKK